MKKEFWVLGLLAVLALQGCSSETQNDMKRDVNNAARKVDNAAQDAVGH